MRKLLLSAAMLGALSAPAFAAIIDVGNNPTSATGHFSNAVGGGPFDDFITFNLTGGPQFLTFASATNDFTGPEDLITGFTGQLFLQVGVPGGGDDIAQNPAVAAVSCGTGCQVLAGTALLNTGNYYLELTGDGGGTAGYGGDITTRAVPGPIVGAGIPGLIAAAGLMLGLARRRKQKLGLA
jgi:hypothetical protein